MRGYPTIDTPVKIHRVDYKGRKITAPYKVSQGHLGPGYTIDGSVLESGFAPNHVSTALEPDQPKQKHRNWNGYVLYGWRTQREARAAMQKHLGTGSGGKRHKAASKPKGTHRTPTWVLNMQHYMDTERAAKPKRKRAKAKRRATSKPSGALGAIVADINRLTK